MGKYTGMIINGLWEIQSTSFQSNKPILLKNICNQATIEISYCTFQKVMNHQITISKIIAKKIKVRQNKTKRFKSTKATCSYTNQLHNSFSDEYSLPSWIELY